MSGRGQRAGLHKKREQRTLLNAHSALPVPWRRPGWGCNGPHLLLHRLGVAVGDAKQLVPQLREALQAREWGGSGAQAQAAGKSRSGAADGGGWHAPVAGHIPCTHTMPQPPRCSSTTSLYNLP